MDKPAVPFWEAAYQDLDVSAFSPLPNPSILEFEHLFDKSWHILEAGCGEAQNALYLAGQGYADVHAFDLSAAAIRKVMNICHSRQLSLHAFVGDLTTYEFRQPCDLLRSSALARYTLYLSGTGKRS